MRFIEAIVSGSTSDVAQCIGDGADVNEPSPHGYPLSVAANQGYPEIVRLLLKAGANTDSRDAKGSVGMPLVETFMGSGNTPLAAAAMGGKTECIRVLLEAGVKPDARALSWVLMDKKFTDLELMMSAGADVNQLDETGTSLLVKAAWYKSMGAVQWLLAHRADPNIANSDGITALMVAKPVEIVQILIEQGADVHRIDKKGRTSLLHAANDQNWQKVKLLIEAGADASLADEDGLSPLLVAVKHRSVGTVKKLLEAGANPNIPFQKEDPLERLLIPGTTPIMLAICIDHRQIIELLIKHGVAADIKNFRGETALALAAVRGNAEVIDWLQKMGASDEPKVYNQDYFNNLLVRAIRAKDLARMQRALDGGADPNARGRDTQKTEDFGKTVLQLACGKEDCRLVKLLLDAGADPNAIEHTNPFIGEGRKPIHEAAELESEVGADGELENCQAIQMLIAAGAGVDDTDYKMRSPLQIAAENGRVEIVRMLLRLGADVDSRTPNDSLGEDFEVDFQSGWDHGLWDECKESGDTSLTRNPVVTYSAAEIACYFGHLEVLKVLADAGAELTATALTFAVRKGHPQIVAFLLEQNPSLTDYSLFPKNSPPCALPIHVLGVPDYTITLRSEDFPNVSVETSEKEIIELALQWAADRQIIMANPLLNAGIHVEVRDRNNRTPLHWASAGRSALQVESSFKNSGHGYHTDKLDPTSIIRKLVEAGADANAIDDEGVTPLMILAQRDLSWNWTRHFPESVTVLLQAGANVDCADHLGRTALMRAAAQNNISFLEALLQSGADSNRVDRQGRSALFFVFEGNSRDWDTTIRVLLDHGAKADLLDNRGRSLLDVILEKNIEKSSKIYQRLEALGVKANFELEHQLIDAMGEKDFDLVRSLLQQGANPNSRFWNRSPLGHAIDPYTWSSYHHWEIVSDLVEHGANVNAPLTGEKHFLIHQAACLEDGTWLSKLLRWGADTNVRDYRGITPVGSAAQSRRWDRVDELLAAGAEIDDLSAIYLETRNFPSLAQKDHAMQWRDRIAQLLESEPQELQWSPGVFYWGISCPKEAERLRSENPNIDERTAARQAARIQIDELVTKHRADGFGHGCYLVAFTGGRGCASSDGWLALFPILNKFTIIATMGTHGNEMSLSNVELIGRLQTLDRTHPFDIRRVGNDILDIDFRDPVADARALVETLHWICSDIVEEYGYKALVAKSIQETQRVHMWWD